MKKKDALELASDMINCVPGITDDDTPCGSGYFTMASYEIKPSVTVQISMELCKYRDTADGHEYYGLYYIPEIDGGDSIDQSEWDYTTKCTKSEVADILVKLDDIFTKEHLTSLYEEYMTRNGYINLDMYHKEKDMVLIQEADLMTVAEYEQFHDIIPIITNSDWYLRQENTTAIYNSQPIVWDNGKVWKSIGLKKKLGIRPILTIDTDNANLDIEDKICIRKILYTVVSTGCNGRYRIVADEIIGKSAFCAGNSKSYLNSTIKDYIDRYGYY